MGERAPNHRLRTDIAPEIESLLRELLDSLFDTVTVKKFSPDPGRAVGQRLVAGYFTGEQSLSRTDDPWAIVAGYRDTLAPGSYLAMSHFTPDGIPEEMAKAVEVFKTTQEPAHPRTHAEVLRLFDGFELAEPGLVYTSQWLPESPEDPGDQSHRSNLYAAVGRKL